MPANPYNASTPKEFGSGPPYLDSFLSRQLAFAQWLPQNHSVYARILAWRLEKGAIGLAFAALENLYNYYRKKFHDNDFAPATKLPSHRFLPKPLLNHRYITRLPDKEVPDAVILFQLEPSFLPMRAQNPRV